mgnify:CR=1 FL=1
MSSPIGWSTQDLNIFAVASSSLSTLTFVVNFNIYGDWGLFNSVPITLDGNAYSYSLTTDPSKGGTLNNWGSTTNVTATCQMSAVSTISGGSSANLIAVSLSNIEWGSTSENIITNGNGIYNLNNITGDYSSLENSVFNWTNDIQILENLWNAVTSGLATGSSSGGNALVGVGVGAIDLLKQNWNFGKYTTAQLEKFTQQNFNLIITQGWNAYFALLKKTPPSAIGSLSSEQLLLGIAALGLIIVLMNRGK